MGIVVPETYGPYKKYNKIISSIYLVIILHLPTSQKFRLLSGIIRKYVQFSCYVLYGEKKVLVIGSQSVLRGFRAIRDHFVREFVETLL